MKPLLRLTLAAALLVPAAASAHEFKAGALEIVHPWARATPAVAKTAAGYLTVINSGTEADRLVGIECGCAAAAMLHETKVENDVASMRHVEAVEIPPGGTVKLAPGGIHVMFVGLTAPFKEEDRLDATLLFEKAGRVPVEFYVQGIASTAPSHEHGKEGQ
ncbi:MAG: copper chaperone PCu(A)C [Parvibaculaceae bacterium]